MKMEIEKEELWDKGDLSFIKLLKDLPEFEEIVRKSRTLMSLNEKRLPNGYPTAEIYKGSTAHAQKLVDKYRLGGQWNQTFSSFICSGIAKRPYGMTISGYAPEFTISGEIPPPPPFEITINEKVGYSRIIDFINEHKSSISKYLNLLPRKKRITVIPAMKREAYILYKENYSFSEIADRINDKYHKALNDVEIRTWINRIQLLLDGKAIK